MKILPVTLLLFLGSFAFAQQPQTRDTTNVQALQGINAKWANGVAPGYWSTAGTGLTLNVSAGTAFCAGTIVTYAGGTLTMTNTTNYIYLDTSSSCAPAVKTSALTNADVPLAVVVAAAGAITTITDDRTIFVFGQAISCSQLPAFTGDVTKALGSCVTVNVNLPTGVTQAGYLLATNIAAPSTPASGKNTFFSDSTDLRFHDKNASGTIGTTAVAKTAGTHKFFSAMSPAGVFTDTQPDVSDLSGSITCSQMPALTGDTTTSAGACATSTVKVNGASVPASAQGVGTNSSSQIITTYTASSGTSVSLTAPFEIYVCTSTCTVTPPVPALGYQFCVVNGDNVATVITMAAIGSSARYENTARTAYGTAGTGTFISAGAVKDFVCIVGLDSTHYLTTNFSGTWTAN